MSTKRAALNRRNPWLYPMAIGLAMGLIVSALTLRLVTRDPLSTDGGTVAVGTDGSVERGEVPGPGEAGVDAAGGDLGGVGADPGSGSNSGDASSGGSTGTGSVDGGEATGQLTASDVGVTPASIRVGIVLLDLGGAAALGAAVPGFDPKVQQEQWQIFIDDLNKRGGVNGRKLEPFYARADPVDPNSQRAACLKLTQDHKVFLVVNAFSALGPSDLCVTAENRTSLVSGQVNPTEYFQRSGGLMITVPQHGNRLFSDWAVALHQLGKLKGRTIGIITDQIMGDMLVNGGLIPALKRFGYEVAYLASVGGTSEIPAHVQQMRLKGVDAVFLASGFVDNTAFVNNADKQRWFPQYFMSDYAGGNVGLLLAGMPESFDGAIGITSYGYGVSEAHPLPPHMQACQDKWNALTGDNTTVDDGQEWANRVVTCIHVNLLEAGLTKAGTNMTRGGFSAAVQRLGAFPLTLLGGEFRPGKTDWSDLVRPIVWGQVSGDPKRQNCNPNQTRCWNEAGPAMNPE